MTDEIVKKVDELSVQISGKHNFRKMNWDEIQQTIVLLGASGVALLSAYVGKWEISTAVILTLLGYTFTGRTIKNMEKNRNGD